MPFCQRQKNRQHEADMDKRSEWVKVAKIFHRDWLKYRDASVRLARDTALQLARKSGQ